MKLYLVLFLLFMYLELFANDFITQMEYGKMVYENPRGIGCNSCHGEKGEGSVLAQYIEKGETIVLKAPSINDKSAQELADGLNSKKNFMPTYFLTVDEILAIYNYLKETNKEKK